jgi:hypothetical protein
MLKRLAMRSSHMTVGCNRSILAALISCSAVASNDGVNRPEETSVTPVRDRSALVARTAAPSWSGRVRDHTRFISPSLQRQFDQHHKR